MTLEHPAIPRPWDRFSILGVSGDILHVAQLHNYMGTVIDRGEKALVLNVNVHALNLAYEAGWMRDFYNQAEVVFCDGAGVILGACMLGYHIQERITYADWMWQYAEFAESRGDTFFFLGARPGVAEKAAARLCEKYPRLKIVGTHHGFFEKAPGSQENETVLQQINACRPNVLVLGFGMPMQEQWLMENWARLDANIALTGGAVFDYISGELRRAPRWMTDHSMEWLGRLIIEPRRLWKRYILGNPLFLWRVLKQYLGIRKSYHA